MEFVLWATNSKPAEKLAWTWFRYNKTLFDNSKNCVHAGKVAMQSRSIGQSLVLFWKPIRIFFWTILEPSICSPRTTLKLHISSFFSESCSIFIIPFKNSSENDAVRKKGKFCADLCLHLVSWPAKIKTEMSSCKLCSWTQFEHLAWVIKALKSSARFLPHFRNHFTFAKTLWAWLND